MDRSCHTPPRDDVAHVGAAGSLHFRSLSLILVTLVTPAPAGEMSQVSSSMAQGIIPHSVSLSMKAAFLLHSPASAHSRHLGDSLELTELQLSEQAWDNATKSTSVELTLLRNPLKSSQIQVAIGFPMFSNYTVSIWIQENHSQYSSWHMAQPPAHGLEHVGRISSALTSSGPNPTIFTLICSSRFAKRPSGQQPESPHGKDQWMSRVS